MSRTQLTLPEDRAFRAFLDHHNPGSVGQLLTALHAYRDALIEFGYLSKDFRGAALDPFVDAAERTAIALASPPRPDRKQP
jgi:hypothetical protein